MSEDRSLLDLVLLDARANLRLAPGAGGTLIRWLAAKQYMQPVAEAVAQTWAEVELIPGELAHELLPGAPKDGAAFAQAIVRFGKPAVALDYPDQPTPRPFYLEIRGTSASRLHADAKDRLATALSLQPVVLTRPHAGRFELSDVPDDERPTERRRPLTSTAPVGTRVEEF